MQNVTKTAKKFGVDSKRVMEWIERYDCLMLTLQVRRATKVTREFIHIVHLATIVAFPRRSLFTSISRGLRKQMKAVLQELVAAAFL